MREMRGARVRVRRRRVWGAMGSEAGVRMQCSGDQVGSAASMSWWKSLLVRKRESISRGQGVPIWIVAGSAWRRICWRSSAGRSVRDGMARGGVQIVCLDGCLWLRLSVSRCVAVLSFRVWLCGGSST